MANAVEQALLLPWGMAMLQNLKKHGMFLSLKRDLALVYSHPFFLAHTHMFEWKEEAKLYASHKAQD